MNPGNKQKRHESGHIQQLKELYPAFPRGRIVASETPDFLISTDQGTIGLELSQLYQSGTRAKPSPQDVTALYEKITAKCKQVYDQMGGIPAVISVFFFENLKLRQKQIPDLAERLAQLVHDASKDESANTIEINPFEPRYNLPKCTDLILVHREPGLTESEWSPQKAYVVPPLTPEFVQERISGKEGKLNEYRRRAKKVWLVLVIDRFSKGGSFTRRGFDESHTYDSDFDKVVLLECLDRRFLELNIRARPQQP